MMGPDGIVEGAIDLVIEDAAGKVTVVDYKTDAFTPVIAAELEAIYAPQMETYVAALRKRGVERVSSRLLFLRMLDGD